MEAYVANWLEPLAWPWLLLVMAASLAVLGKAADWLVQEAVVLSERSGVPKVVIGATIVSLGTTTPEAAVSVLAAFRGSPQLALGNAVGSIICDTGLILGLACLVAPLEIPRRITSRQGWLQLGAGVLLVVSCIPWTRPLAVVDSHFVGRLPQAMGFAFLAILGWYLWQSVRWAKRGPVDEHELEDLERDLEASWLWVLAKLTLAIALVVGASNILIPTVEIAAERLGIPQAIIAATLVAFGTSLPELVTAVTAARHGHGSLAVGNVIGADILNVLFVAGASAAVTPGGLEVSNHFFKVLFPTMLFVLIVFRVGIMLSGDRLNRGFGVVLLAAYLVVSAVSYLDPPPRAEGPDSHSSTLSSPAPG